MANAEKKPGRPIAGPIVGRFWRFSEELNAGQVRQDLHMALKELPVIDDGNRRGPLINDFAQIVIDYYSLLIDSQRLPKARETALALEEIAEFARTAQPASVLPRSCLPWGHLPTGPRRITPPCVRR